MCVVGVTPLEIKRPNGMRHISTDAGREQNHICNGEKGERRKWRERDNLDMEQHMSLCKAIFPTYMHTLDLNSPNLYHLFLAFIFGGSLCAAF